MFIDANNGIVVGNGGTILNTINGGTTWTSSTSGTTQNLNAVYYADASNVWACGNNGIILKSSDGGVTWASEISGTTEMLNAIHGIGITDIWACGNNGTIIYRTGTTSVFENQLQINISVYPNPFPVQTTFQTDAILKNSTLAVYNLFGQTVKEIENISGQIIVLSRDNLTDGLYFVRLTQDNQVIATKKIVITD